MKHFILAALLLFLCLTSCQKEFLTSETSSQIPRKERIRTIKQITNDVSTKSVAVKNKLWKPGDTIRIKFLNGSTTIQDKVKTYAAEWLNYAYLYFEYVDHNADVKIGFDLDSRYLAWSTIGTACKQIPQDSPSLNFVWLEEEEDAIIKSEVLRSFGHILGLGFEHRNPNSPIQFNSRMQNYFQNTWGLSEEDVVNDILPIYNSESTNYSEYDKESIMILDIPRTIVTNPSNATSSNMELSQTDKTFISELYPFPSIATMTTQKTSINFTIVKTSNIEVDWGDGTRDTNIFTHTYNIQGNHTIKFYGSATALKEFICEFNQLTTLNIKGNCALARLECKDNKLTQLDLSTNPALMKLNCEFNQLTSLDISKTNMTQLDCSFNQINELVLNHQLTDLGCSDNQLINLDVSNAINLSYLNCLYNPISNYPSNLLEFVETLPNHSNREAGTLVIDSKANSTISNKCASKNWSILN